MYDLVRKKQDLLSKSLELTLHARHSYRRATKKTPVVQANSKVTLYIITSL